MSDAAQSSDGAAAATEDNAAPIIAQDLIRCECKECMQEEEKVMVPVQCLFCKQPVDKADDDSALSISYQTYVTPDGIESGLLAVRGHRHGSNAKWSLLLRHPDNSCIPTNTVMADEKQPAAATPCSNSEK